MANSGSQQPAPYPGSPALPRLVRPRSGRWIGGVCAGLADRFGLSRGLVRLLFVLSTLLPGPQILVYLVLWIVIPNGE